MRIISGSFRSRIVNPTGSAKWPVRPTTDRAREALFNILANRLDWPEISMLDLFGGTGLHSVEAISRGCEDVVYVDRYDPAVRFITSLSVDWGFDDRIDCRKADVFQFLLQAFKTFDYIFADPPYDHKDIDKLPALVLENGWLKEEGLLVIEHPHKVDFSSHTSFSELRKYGQSAFSFFKYSSD